MLSFLLPKNVTVFCSPSLIIIKYKDDLVVKKTGRVSFNLVSSTEGDRLFASGPEASSALNTIYTLVFGLTRGYQQRLRLVGIGFRARLNVKDQTDNKLYTKNYRRKRINRADYTKIISIKIGYSHESVYPIRKATDNEFVVSSPEGRSKGRLIDIKSKNYAAIKQAAAEIRSFRYPDAYKGKGIFYNNEVIKLKKGKRQG